MNPIVSIIVAAYNAEKTIEKLLQSVYSQGVDRSQYELIIIDDGSTDRTGAVLDALVGTYPDMRLVIRHITNGGVCHARNFGLSLARGEFVTFIDSDDYYGDNILQSFFDYRHRYPHIDLWKYGAVEHYIEHNRSIRDKINSVVPFISESSTDILRMALEMEYIPLFGYVWNGFYRLSIINVRNIRFSDQYIMEDFIFSFEYLTYAGAMGTIPEVYYHYILDFDKSSLSKQWEPKYYEMYRLKVETIYKYMQVAGIDDIDCFQLLSRLYVKYMYSSLERMGLVISVYDKYKWLRLLWKDSLYKAMRQYMCCGFSLIGILSGLLKYKCTIAVILCTEGISFVRHRCKGLFAKIKSS
ncbi:glycosyltransferase, group 2 family protein [Veillonella sp. AS16]|nr:glycosyltransferase, group 2 family protein [Veillonella sp. AS16]